jgi:thiamine pyrophosphokinase
LAKLTLLQKVKGEASFLSRWGVIYHKDEPQDVPVDWAVCYMTDTAYEVSFEKGDLDGISKELLADIAENLGMDKESSLTDVKKAVIPQVQRSRAKKVAESVSALLPKKTEKVEEEPPVVEESTEEEPSEE